MPPRATSNTAKSTRGFCSTILAERGPEASALMTSRSSITTPSVEVIPTLRPMPLKMWAIIREVVVLPLVPVTATIGIRLGAARREEHVDHRLGDVLRVADGRMGVHPEAGGGVDLADRRRRSHGPAG